MVFHSIVAELQEEKSNLEEEVANLKKQHEEALEKLEEEKQEELKNLQETLNKEKEEEFVKSNVILCETLFLFNSQWCI